jgi:tRNA-specific 2-thiouridylase
MAPFLAAYLGGETPSPCVDCNTYVKFGALLGRARQLYDCEAVATGHYARRDEAATGAARLLRAHDRDKDQTYFLYGLRQDQLAHARFPLGDVTKPEVRAVARSLGLVTADKPESQEICFVPGGDYRDALRTRAAWTPERGPSSMPTAAAGEHDARRFTVGQRKGLNALGEPRYVSRIDPATTRSCSAAGRTRDARDPARRRHVRRRRPARGTGRRRRLAAVPGPGADPPPRAARPGDGPAGDGL